MRNVKVLCAPALIALAAGCASQAPPAELVSARTAYDKALRGPAGTLAPADVHTAAETLSAAEQSYQHEGATQDTKDIAYTAERRAQIAEVRANTVQAQSQRDAVLAQIGQSQALALQRTQEELARTNERLAVETVQAQEAARRAAEATALLAHIATVRTQQRNVIITLSGSVLFAFGRADLLPEARAKLSQVAAVLEKAPSDNHFVVRGYTDSIGAFSTNQELSQQRADAVRTYLASHGVAGDRITAQGFGPADPVADNGTPEGRANNRRVEIVVQPSTPAAPTTP
jgi:outer membrane protein OmpA-like peptidoglycan-associated protein